jgi:Trp operon repressor
MRVDLCKYSAKDHHEIWDAVMLEISGSAISDAKIKSAQWLLAVETPPKDVAVALGVSVATLYRHGSGQSD